MTRRPHFKVKRSNIEAIVLIVVLAGMFMALASRMGGGNLLKTIMNTAHQLLLNTVFYLMGITVLTGALSKLLSEFGVVKLLEKLRNESGCTIIMISHSMDDIARHATKVLVFEQGEISMYDTPQAVFSHADVLERYGLSVPSVTKLCFELKQRGVNIPTTICTEDAFLNWFEEVKKHA